MADSPKTGNQEFGDLLREAREDRGMSRRDLAEATGLSYPYISQLETGYRLPSPTAIQTLSRVLHVSLDSIFAAITHPADQPPTAPRRRVRATPLGWVENGSFATGPTAAAAMEPPSSAEHESTAAHASTAAGSTAEHQAQQWGTAGAGARRSREVPPSAATASVSAGAAPDPWMAEVVVAVLDLLSRVPASNRLHALAQIQEAVLQGIIDEGIRQSRQS